MDENQYVLVFETYVRFCSGKDPMDAYLKFQCSFGAEPPTDLILILKRNLADAACPDPTESLPEVVWYRRPK